MHLKGYYWCSAHREGHDLGEPRCELWQSAMKETEIRNDRRHNRWKRAANRGLRIRLCVFCRQRFDAGPTRGRGRPRETCSQTCADGREVERQRLRRHGLLEPARKPRKRKRRPNEWIDRVQLRNGGHRVSPELRQFLDAFPDGGWTID